MRCLNETAILRDVETSRILRPKATVAKVTRDGRIVLWKGASLWAFDVLPNRKPRSNLMHAHHAFQITLSAGGTVGILPGGLAPGPVILIASDVPHALQAEGRIAHLFVEPESRPGAGLRRLLGKSGMELSR